ncbi:MAG: sugar phosphate nucleotidyltransferase [Haloarculaceae archaeon]
MDAVVLAGGYATRLWPITRNRPKMLLPIGETTVIDRVLGQLEDDDRVDTVYISTNERFADEFRDHVADRDYGKTQLSVEETTDEDEKFGVVGALAQLVDREGVEDEDLLVVAGDNVISFEMSEFIDSFEAADGPTLAAYDVGSTELASAYGTLSVDENDVVTRMQEKPEDPDTTLVSIACYAFPADAVRFEEYLAGDNNPDEPGWFIMWLVDHERVIAFEFDEAWFDIGTPESYLETVAWQLDGGTIVADEATLADVELGENVHVMGDARVVDSTLDNSVVFPGATVRDCEVTGSIVDRDASLDSLVLDGALIGENTRIPGGRDD